MILAWLQFFLSQFLHWQALQQGCWPWFLSERKSKLGYLGRWRHLWLPHTNVRNFILLKTKVISLIVWMFTIVFLFAHLPMYWRGYPSSSRSGYLLSVASAFCSLHPQCCWSCLDDMSCMSFMKGLLHPDSCWLCLPGVYLYKCYCWLRWEDMLMMYPLLFIYIHIFPCAPTLVTYSYNFCVYQIISNAVRLPFDLAPGFNNIVLTLICLIVTPRPWNGTWKHVIFRCQWQIQLPMPQISNANLWQ